MAVIKSAIWFNSVHHYIICIVLKHGRILAEGLQEDWQVQVKETEAGHKAGKAH